MNCAVHSDTPAAAYCRTCGKALCENCKRDVQGAIYCEPCIAARLQGSRVVAPAPASAPSPGVALLLGFIPGVGAMYNGQFIKGFVHVMIFVMLVIATDRYDAFGFAIAVFCFYMVFDAYKTAQAKLLGQPLPDLLGIDKMFGLQESQPPVSPSATATAAVPPTAAAPAATVAPAQVQTPPANNEPIGAIVLIVLGVVLLIGTIAHLHVGKLLFPLFLIGIGMWIAYKRLSAGSGAAR